MPTLIMLQGLPGSGKSTLATAMYQSGVVGLIVEKDQIRAQLESGGWSWTHENEQKDVIPERDRRIEDALRAGLSVVSADTNFGRKHKTRLAQIARDCHADFEVQRVDVTVEECIRRDGLRTSPIGHRVIRAMWLQFVANDPEHFPVSAGTIVPAETVVQDRQLPKAIICDLDGTLALNFGHRGHYDASTCDQDALNRPVVEILDKFDMTDQYTIIYLTGREEIHREPTVKFLTKYNCPVGPLLMRGAGDTRKDVTVKLELFNAHVRGKYFVEFCLEDRPRVVRMWQSIGLPTLVVGDLKEF